MVESKKDVLLLAPHCTLHTAHCTLHATHCKLHSVHCTIYKAQNTTQGSLRITGPQHTAHSTHHTPHWALQAEHCTLITVHCVLIFCPGKTFRGREGHQRDIRGQGHCTYISHCTLHTAHFILHTTH